MKIRDWRPTGECEHYAHFYTDAEELLDGLEAFFLPWLEARQASVLIGLPEHRAGWERRLSERGFEPDRLRREGLYFSHDARGALEEVMREGHPDPQRFGEYVAGLILGAQGHRRQVRVYSEMGSLLANPLELEEMWNELGSVLIFSLLCGYPWESAAEDPERFLELVNAHSLVVPGACERARQLARLQERALRDYLPRQREGMLQTAARLGHFELDSERRLARGSATCRRHLGLAPGAPLPYTELARLATGESRLQSADGRPLKMFGEWHETRFVGVTLPA